MTLKERQTALLGMQAQNVPKGKQCYIIPAISYLIFETFRNSPDFDMKKVKQID